MFRSRPVRCCSAIQNKNQWYVVCTNHWMVVHFPQSVENDVNRGIHVHVDYFPRCLPTFLEQYARPISSPSQHTIYIHNQINIFFVCTQKAHFVVFKCYKPHF